MSSTITPISPASKDRRPNMSTSPVQDQQNMSTSQQQHQKLLDALISNHKSFSTGQHCLCSIQTIIFILCSSLKNKPGILPPLILDIGLHRAPVAKPFYENCVKYNLKRKDATIGASFLFRNKSFQVIKHFSFKVLS